MLLIADRPERLDQFLARHVEGVSRTRLAKLIAAGDVLVDGQIEKPAFKLEPGMEVELELPGETPPHDLTPFPMPLDIVYEDDDLLVVNKPRGLATHPAHSLHEPSLVNALLAHGADLSSGSAAFRPGIVHRLDKETTGLIVVAKNDRAHAVLAAQIAAKTAQRGYFAVVAGSPSSGRFDIDAPLGRDPRNRLRMSVDPNGRAALTHVLFARKTPVGTLLGVRLSTGRTHQIRAHLAVVGLPVVGDRTYGGGEGALQLHAGALTFVHPVTGTPLSLTCPTPDDFIGQPEAKEFDDLAS